MKDYFKPSLNYLLFFVPLSVVLKFYAKEQYTWIFICSCLAIIPLAGWMGRATEHLAERTSEGLGGLLNATFGNAAELIIAIVALNNGLVDIVKASLTGSIIGNILLVLGLSFLAGGLKVKIQEFNVTGARTQATMLFLGASALIIPTMYHYIVGPNHDLDEGYLSLEISIVLLITYAISLLFALRTHKQLFSGAAVDVDEHADLGDKHTWSLQKAGVILLIATALVAWMSEILVGAVEHTASAIGMSNVFIGVIVVAIVGNAAEHSTAILFAIKNRMDLSLSIAIGSSIQIALFVAPVLVLLSYAIAPSPMNLVFTPAEILAVTLSVLIVEQIAGDGKSNWFEGVQLLSLYCILALVFYFMPSAPTVGH